jgi:hypothetical protein
MICAPSPNLSAPRGYPPSESLRRVKVCDMPPHLLIPLPRWGEESRREGPASKGMWRGKLERGDGEKRYGARNGRA